MTTTYLTKYTADFKANTVHRPMSKGYFAEVLEDMIQDQHSIEESGIGAYEFHGARGFDKGSKGPVYDGPKELLVWLDWKGSNDLDGTYDVISIYTTAGEMKVGVEYEWLKTVKGYPTRHLYFLKIEQEKD